MQDRNTAAEITNQALWDELAPVHFRAYEEVEMLRRGECVLDELELRALGDVRGKRLLHLQCHIGTDTLSWARRGAVVTGVDFSLRSLEHARRLRDELGLQARFLHANVYDLSASLNEQFDVVYTSRGVLCWLRDLDAWARTVARFLAPGGTFYLMESHPICNVFEVKDGQLAIANRYFGGKEPTCWSDAEGDYADGEYVPQHPSYEWEWTVSDIVNAVLGAGLQLQRLEEHERLFFRRWPGMAVHSPRWFFWPQHVGKLPLLFTLLATRPGGESS